MNYLIWGLLFLFSINNASADLPYELPSQKEILKIRSAIIKTEKGDIFLRLFPKEAPIHTANFKYLADKGFYNNIRVHIFLENYLVHLASGPNYSIPPEFNDLKHTRGRLSMVRKPDHLDLEHSRNSHGSQFRIILEDSFHMDGLYVVFAEIIKGFEVARNLRKGDLIEKIEVFVK